MNVSDSDIFKASLDHARQLSALRFAILTVFMTANAALFNAYFTTSINYPPTLVAFAGFWLAIVFLGCEIALSFTMAAENSVAREKAGAHHRNAFRHRNWLALWTIRLLIPSIYILSIVYWLTQFLKH